MKVVDYKCISCGGKIIFNPLNQKWDCGYCGSSFDLEELKKNYKDLTEENNTQEIEYDCYNCPSCGAEIILDENMTATYCVYCGSNSIIRNKLKGEFKPSRIIPFKKTKDDAIKAFKSYKKGKLFIPREFLDERNIEKLSAIYVPFYIYDCDITSNVRMTGTRVSSWSDSSYYYTKTDFYSLERDAQSHFEDIPVDGSTKFPDDIMNSIEPFDSKELKEFYPVYLTGYLSEHFDLTMDELFDNAKNRAQKSVEGEVLKTANGYASRYIEYSNHNAQKNDTSEYVLLPVYMLNVKFKDKIHTFAMNGQTGKFVGNIPVDWKKFWIWWSGLFIIIAVIMSIIMIVPNL